MLLLDAVPFVAIPLDRPSRLPTSPSRRSAFSLLEVIIATGILTGSAMMLMSLFSTADRHADRAEERMIAQMLCQNKLEELIAHPDQLQPSEAEVLIGYPNWICSVAVAPTTLNGLVRVDVAVSRIPGMPTESNQSVLANSGDATPMVALSNLPEEPTMVLTRWLRGSMDPSQQSESNTTLGDRKRQTSQGDSSDTPLLRTRGE